MTNQQLNKAVESETRITQEMTDIFVELDETNSVSTQAELNHMLVKLYKRLGDEEIVIERFGDRPATPEEFAAWIDEDFDDYTTKLFHKDI